MSVAAASDSSFVAPDWTAPLDPEAHLADVPDNARVKGMFPQGLLDLARDRGRPLEGFGPYRSFKDYPMAEVMRLELAVARAVHPDLPLREGLRRLGHLAYGTLSKTMIGRIVFGPLTGNWPALFKLASKGYGISLSVGRAEVLEVESTQGIVRLIDMYNFADAYQVGVFEGTLQYYERPGGVWIRPQDRYNIDLLVRWA